MTLHELIPILQIAIGPVILISGIGLLLLSMTNRLARVIDRSRQLSQTLGLEKVFDPTVVVSQIQILSTRARLVKHAITLATLSILFAAVLVITLFLAAVLRWEVGGFVAILFIACMGSLIVSLIAFLRDINLSLAALKLELEAKRGQTLEGKTN
jgi:hypothetical protein